MIKKYSLVFITLFCSFIGFGQIWTEDFSTDTNYTVSLGGEGNDGLTDYFQRTNGSSPSIGIIYSGGVNVFFAAQDIDDGGWTGSASPSQLTWTGINISGFTSLEFNGNFASTATAAIDSGDYVLLEYRIDGGTWNNLLAFENDGTAFNEEFGEDTNFDGDSDGNDLTGSFSLFNKSVSGTGSSLDIRITVSVNSGNEDFAFDEFEIWGTASCTPPAPPSGTITTTQNCGSTDLDFPDNATWYWQTTATGTDTSNDTQSTYNVTTSGTYHVRAFDGTCWSTGTVSQVVTITSPITISVQPIDQSENVGNTATFNVTASNAISYQWQVSINGGSTWSNVGTDSNSYTTPTLTLVMDNDQYQVVITGTSPCTNVTSVSATLSVSTGPCVSESFNNSGNSGSYGTENWTGDDGIDWTATDSRSDQDLNGNEAILLRSNNNGVLSNDTSFPGGCGVISFDYARVFSNNSTLQVWVNGVQFGGDITVSSPTVSTFMTTVNVTGNIDLEIRNVGASNDQRALINNLSWTCFSCTAPNDPVGTISSLDAPDFCGSADLDYSESASGNVTFYWQTTTNGTDTTNDATNSLIVTVDGSFYVRAYDSSLGCWSDGEVGPYDVTISDLAQITDQPDNINVTSGANAIFSVIATNAISYQWQQSVDNGITWTDIGGANSSTLTVSSVDLSMFGNLYQVIITNVCGDIESDEAVLFVHSGSPCIEEDFVSFPDAGWINNGTTSDSFNGHYGAASPCREFNTGNSVITSEADYPTILEFYQDSSNGGNGSTASIDYSLNGGSTWLPLYSFDVTDSGKTELIDLTDISGVDLSAEQNVSFRFNATFNSWYLDDLKVYCTPCTLPALVATTNPSSGPAKTLVTISGSNFNGLTTVAYNSVDLILISQTAVEIVVQLPSNAVDGNFVISTPTFCSSTIPFDVINNKDTGCQSNINPNPTDLFFYEIFDEDQNIDGSGGVWGNGGMVTLFNGTLETLNLSDYRIYRTTDYSNLATYPYSLWHSLTGTLAPGELYRIKVTNSNCSYSFSYEEEIIGFNANDGFELRKNNGSSFVSIDQIYTPNYVGYYYVRDLTASNKPTPTYNGADWTITDVFPSMPYCVGAGVTPDFESGTPTISINDPGNVCNSATLVATASEGYTGLYSPPDSADLNFQWYYYDGITDIWNTISTGGDYTITNTTTESTLVVDNAFTKMNYQFYCEVLENDDTCYTASDAVQLSFATTTWTSGNTWSDGVPDINTIIYIDADYNTSTDYDGAAGHQWGSFSACQLYINAGVTLTIGDSYYVEVENNTVVEGSIIVQTQGSFVQNNDAATFTLGINGSSQMNKDTAPLMDWHDYTYWSSPGQNITVGSALPFSIRRFYYNSGNYLDADGDGIDDDANDWLAVNGGNIMTPGLGYIASHTNIGFNTGISYQYNFNGAFNNGSITPPFAYNAINPRHWNLVGNPYPCAIDINDFWTENVDSGRIEKIVYLWSHYSPALAGNIGNDNLNYSISDYALINGSGPLAGASGDTPGMYIPSGQSFFINSLSNTDGDLTFNNSMRIAVDGANNLFFRESNTKKVNTKIERLWLNLTTDNGVFNQVLIAYHDNATDGYDGLTYDAEPVYTGYANLFTTIENESRQLAIQGKASESLTIDEIIPLGFNAWIEESIIYTMSIPQTEGDFLQYNSIYLIDNLLNTSHNLSESEYNFTSEYGAFENRFEIVFKAPSTLNVEENSLKNSLKIIEQENGYIQFKLDSNFEFKTIDIVDILGRTLYSIKTNGKSKILNLENINTGTYIARITLSNDTIITKKAIKQK